MVGGLTNTAYPLWRVVGGVGNGLFICPRGTETGAREETYYIDFLASVTHNGSQVSAPAAVPQTYVTSTNFRWEVTGQRRPYHGASSSHSLYCELPKNEDLPSLLLNSFILIAMTPGTVVLNKYVWDSECFSELNTDEVKNTPRRTFNY